MILGIQYIGGVVFTEREFLIKIYQREEVGAVNGIIITRANV